MIFLNENSPSIREKVLMSSLKLSLMEKSDIQESANVLSIAMLNAKLHVAVLLGKSENERQEIKKMFIGLFTQLPGIVFLAKEKQQIVGVMRMKSCEGFKPVDAPEDPEDENDIVWRKLLTQNKITLSDWLSATRDTFLRLSLLISKEMDIQIQ